MIPSDIEREHQTEIPSELGLCDGVRFCEPSARAVRGPKPALAPRRPLRSPPGIRADPAASSTPKSPAPDGPVRSGSPHPPRATASAAGLPPSTQFLVGLVLAPLPRLNCMSSTKCLRAGFTYFPRFLQHSPVHFPCAHNTHEGIILQFQNSGTGAGHQNRLTCQNQRGWSCKASNSSLPISLRTLLAAIHALG